MSRFRFFIIFTTIATLLTLTSFPLRAQYHYLQSQKAISSQNARLAYSHALNATKLMPWIAQYHIAYSQINLAIAISLSSTSSDKDVNQISQFISQAIREGRSAISLRPKDPHTWANLGQIYADLIGSTENASQLAIDNYARAIALDPINPSLRLIFGNLFMNTQDYSRAISEIKIAIRLEPNFINAYYNLAQAYKYNGDLESARSTLEQALSQTTTDSPLYPQLQLELEQNTTSSSPAVVK